MAQAIADSLYEVYKTAASELGIRDTLKKRDAFKAPPGVPEVSDAHLAGKHPDGCRCPDSMAAAAVAAAAAAAGRLDVFEAARRENLSFLRGCDPEALASRDSSGHTVAHWACLHGHASVVQFLYDQGGLELCHRPSQHELAQYPLHWACVNGHVPVVELLLRLGVPIDVRDAKGTTPLVVACQYGQTVTAGFLLSRGASTANSQDTEGDTALHWAAFKGQPDLMRLLVYAGLNPHQRDGFGQTPLHLACIGGNISAVRDLCRVDKVELNVADKNGKTPLMLAAGRRHTEVERFLKAEIRTRASMLGFRLRWSHLVFGPPGNTKAPMLFFLFCVLLWGYPTYLIKAVPLTFSLFPWLHALFLLSNAVMWLSFYHANTKDPGFLPRNVPEYDRAIQQAGVNTADIGLGRKGNPLERLCHTCRCVKPIRTKHCRVCNRCVLDMDHHCPYIYNCVGRNNRFWFAIFTVTMVVVGLLTFILAYFTLRQGGFEWHLGLGILASLLAFSIGSVVSSCVWYHAALNMTTNESMNKKRYTYLKDANGNYRNPFDRGVLNNLLEFCHLRSPRYTMQEMTEIKVVPMDV